MPASESPSNPSYFRDMDSPLIMNVTRGGLIAPSDWRKGHPRQPPRAPPLTSLAQRANLS